MSSHDWQRLLQHLPIGGIAAWVAWQNLGIGLGLLASTFIYEAMNDWRKGDKSYKDVLGICWVFGIVAIIIIILGKLL